MLLSVLLTDLRTKHLSSDALTLSQCFPPHGQAIATTVAPSGRFRGRRLRDTCPTATVPVLQPGCRTVRLLASACLAPAAGKQRKQQQRQQQQAPAAGGLLSVALVAELLIIWKVLDCTLSELPTSPVQLAREVVAPAVAAAAALALMASTFVPSLFYCYIVLCYLGQQLLKRDFIFCAAAVHASLPDVAVKRRCTVTQCGTATRWCTRTRRPNCTGLLQQPVLDYRFRQASAVHFASAGAAWDDRRCCCQWSQILN